MTPRTGRPPNENSRTERLSIRISKADKEQAEHVYGQDRKEEETFSAWVSRKFSEMIRKLGKK